MTPPRLTEDILRHLPIGFGSENSRIRANTRRGMADDYVLLELESDDIDHSLAHQSGLFDLF